MQLYKNVFKQQQQPKIVLNTNLNNKDILKYIQNA